MTLQRGQRTDRHPPFKYSAHTRVDFSDTDAQAIVYYGRYLPYFDMARVEYLRELELLDPSPREVSNKLLNRDSFKPATTLNVLAACWLQPEGAVPALARDRRVE